MTGILLFIGLALLLTSFIGLVHHKRTPMYWFTMMIGVSLVLMYHGMA